MPNRAVLKRWQTAWRAFAQTVTLVPLTTTDGVSHAYCAPGYVTALRMPSCVLNLIWTTQAQTNRHGHGHMCETYVGRDREGAAGWCHDMKILISGRYLPTVKYLDTETIRQKSKISGKVKE